MKLRLLFISLFIPVAVIVFSQNLTTEEYIAKYKDIALREMKIYGIPASITLAQGILESNNGNSVLATKANNHFGIKCTSTWNGKTYNYDDDKKNECFRKYNNAEDSYIDHSEFLRGRPHYASLFELDRTDYVGWANGLKKAGYATNPKYPQLLINLIERYHLHAFDSKGKNAPLERTEPPVLADKKEQEKTENDISVNNRVKYVTVEKGQSLKTIAKENNLTLWNLLKYNDLEKNSTVNAGDKIYIHPKRRKGNEKYHVVKEGETMRLISQVEGVKLKLLYKRNKMERGMEPATGEKLYLRGKRAMMPQLYKERIRPIDTPKPIMVKKTEADTPGKTKSQNRYHEVEKGDTLYSISRKYSLTVDELKKINKLDADTLNIGQRLVVER